jgi:hypothetical protein
MDVRSVAEALAPEALAPPGLNALVPNENNYKVLLLQPHGNFDSSSAGVRNRDRELAEKQYAQFLADGHQTDADLVMTPEYSMPWDSLTSAIESGIVPRQGKLWALGCESLKYSEIEQIRERLSLSAVVICEHLEPDPERFVDPLAYVFAALPIEGDGPAKIVILIQFKTTPMADNDHFEINNLQLGTRVYRFGTLGQTVTLLSLICSDALAFEDAHAQAIYDRALILHIQLNAKPRHDQFRQYRDRLLRYKGDETEILCLNWAENVCQWNNGHETQWNNIAGSAWYLRPQTFDDRDATLSSNHRRGLYYTWLGPLYCHALFFNYQPATYLLHATKVAHLAVPAVLSRRTGPKLIKASIWDDATGSWIERTTAEDGFSAIVNECGNAKDNIQSISDSNPLETERVLALCAGRIGHAQDWHRLRHLDSCIIDLSEVILRITYCQDTHERAQEFRIARLKRCAYLWDILSTPAHLPAALSDFNGGFRLEWSASFPHQNAISTAGQRATVIYMSEDSSDQQIEETAKRAAQNLGAGFTEADQIVKAKQRLAVWFRKDGSVLPLDPHRYVKIDQTGVTSEVDIAREK